MPEDEPKPNPAGVDPLILPRRRAMPLREAAEDDLAESVPPISQRLEVNRGSSGDFPSARRGWKKTHERGLDDAAKFRGKLPSAKTRNSPKRAPKGGGLAVWIVGQAFCLLLIGLGYFVGQLGNDANPPAGPAAASPAEPEPPAPVKPRRGVSQKAFDVINSAMSSARNGDAPNARQTLETAQRQELIIPGLDYRLALLALERADMREAKLRLDAAMASGDELAACCYVRAMLAGRIGDYGRASEECSKAVYAEPFNARYLFFWAECLRRNGRLKPSLEHFEEALTRPASPLDREFIAFKFRLAKIEAGRAADFSADLARRLTTEPGDPLWLLTAAAMALEAGDPGGAATLLEKASHLLPAADFDTYIRDYLLISHSAEKEIAPFFRRTAAPVNPSPNVAAITVDPISWTLEAADPGAWPSAALSR